MNPSRRRFVSQSAVLATAAWGASARAMMPPEDKFDLLIKGGELLDPSQNLRGRRDIGIRHGVVQEVAADLPAARAARARRERQAGDAGPDRPPRAHLSVRLGDRHSGRRAGAVSGHHHGGIGRRRRRQQPGRVPSPHRGADADADVRLHPHRQSRAVGLSGARALQPPTRAGRHCCQGAGRKCRHRARHQGADVGKRHCPARPRAAATRHRRLRARGHARQGDDAHRRRRDGGADVARSSTCCARATS